MIASTIIIIILLLVIIVIGVIYFLFSKNQAEEIKIIENENKDLSKNINYLHKKAKEVKSEKKATNIDDLLIQFSTIKRNFK